MHNCRRHCGNDIQIFCITKKYNVFIIFLQSNALYNLIIPSGTLFVTLLFTGMVMTQEVEWVVF